MSALRVAGALMALVVVSACGSPERSNGDTTSAASSTPPAVTAQPVDNTSAPLEGVAPSASTVAPKPAPVRTATGSKPAGSSKAPATPPPPKRTDSIIGYDSIIRMPIRALPTTPPTPTR